MSKSLKNYPDPLTLLDATGADALRVFLINSPVVRAEPLRFTEQGVRDVVRTVLLPFWNAYSFFTTYAAAEGLAAADLTAAPHPDDRPEIDRWILSVLQSLVKQVNLEMEGYYLYNVITPLISFVDHLTNWYIRRSRRRFWSARSEDDEVSTNSSAAFATLYDVLVTFAKLMAPVLPFVTETMYQGLVVSQRDDGETGPASVHHEDYPEVIESIIDEALERQMNAVRTVVSLGRGLRVTEGLKIRQPLAGVTIVSHDGDVRTAIAAHADLIAEELNVKSVETSADEASHAHLGLKPNFRTLGPRFGSAMKEAAIAIANLEPEVVERMVEGGTAEVLGQEITLADVFVIREARQDIAVVTGDNLSVAIDTALTSELLVEGVAREIVKVVQKLRRAASLDVSDRITLRWDSAHPNVLAAMDIHGEWIAAETLATELINDDIGTSVALGGDATIILSVDRS